MADFWKSPAFTAVIGWFLIPFITSMANKLWAYVCIDIVQNLKKLERHSVPEAEKKLSAVQKQIILRSAARDTGSDPDLPILDEMATDLRSVLYDADEAIDLVAYDKIDVEVARQGTRELADACIAHCKERFGQSLFAAALSRCREGLYHLDQSWWEVFGPQGTFEEQQLPRHLPPDGSSEASLNSVPQRLRSFFLAFCKFCGSKLSWLGSTLIWLGSILIWLLGFIFNCLRHVFLFIRRCRDFFYEFTGIEHNKMDGIGLGYFQLRIHGKSLRKIMKDFDHVITTVSMNAHLLNEESSSSSSSSSREEIADMHRNIAQPKVIGREKDQSAVSKLLRRKGPSSVIVIHGIAGSGKTTLARCVCNYEKEKTTLGRYICEYDKETDSKYFDPIMFIQVSKTFRLHDIFIGAIMEIVGQDGKSCITDLTSIDSQGEELKDKLKGKSLKVLGALLKEKLKGKCFLLVLDDLWPCVIGDENEEMQRDILRDVLTAGNGGSRILVTAQKEDAAVDLGACKNIAIRKLEQPEYLSLFMHYALRGWVDDGTRDDEFQWTGSEIAEKLHRLPQAAVIVAKRLRGKNIDIWKRTANQDVLNETMGALWWSYEQLSSPEVRRCFEYCSTFPRGFMFDRLVLIQRWIAQGFVKTRKATEDPEAVGQCYIDELLAFSFFSATSLKGVFRIHDLLHEFVERVAGSDCFRIGVNGFDSQQGIIPREVRHLMIQTYDTWEMAMTEQILKFENLRTLIIEEKYRHDEYTAFDDVQPQDLVEEKFFEDIFKKMRKLRVLIIEIKYRQNRVLSISESIGQMKHLRIFSFYIYYDIYRPCETNLIFPSSVTQLYQLQVFEFFGGEKVSFLEDSATFHTRGMRISFVSPNISRLTSLQSLRFYEVREEEGYELRQLKHINKLRGHLHIHGLRNVRSKEEAVEANLAGKMRLTEVLLNFKGSNPDVAEGVLEGLLPPKNLERLSVWNYRGSWCPSWMLSRQNHPDAPKNLDRLFLYRCSQLGHIPEGSELFAGLRWLTLWGCTWSALPDHMERLTSLKKLEIFDCDEIELLPTLPQSLENILIAGEKSKLWRSLQDEMHVNRQKIEHVSCKEFNPPITGYGVHINLHTYWTRT